MKNTIEINAPSMIIKASYDINENKMLYGEVEICSAFDINPFKMTRNFSRPFVSENNLLQIVKDQFAISASDEISKLEQTIIRSAIVDICNDMIGLTKVVTKTEKFNAFQFRGEPITVMPFAPAWVRDLFNQGAPKIKMGVMRVGSLFFSEKGNCLMCWTNQWLEPKPVLPESWIVQGEDGAVTVHSNDEEFRRFFSPQK